MVIIPFLSNASGWDDNELRYCLRSICEHIPDDRVIIVGTPPSWYTGERMAYNDKKGLAFKTWNIIEKIKLAAPEGEFIFLNDDIFILAPVCGNHYKGDLSQTHKGLGTYYRRQVEATIALIGDVPDFDTHGPMIMNGKVFKALPWPAYKEPYILLKTFYAYYTHDAGGFYPDLKLTRRYTPAQLIELLEGRLYFSVSDSGINLALATWLKNRFPQKCKYEK